MQVCWTAIVAQARTITFVQVYNGTAGRIVATVDYAPTEKPPKERWYTLTLSTSEFALALNAIATAKWKMIAGGRGHEYIRAWSTWHTPS